MTRWLRMIRGMIVTGVAFGVGVGLLTSLIGLPLWLLGPLSVRNLFQTVARFSVVSCVIGVAFSGLVAITARGRPFHRLSLAHFAGLGAGVGFLYFLFMGITGAFWVWSLSTAIANLVLVTVTGAGSATAMLMLARRGQPRLTAGEELPTLDDAPR